MWNRREMSNSIILYRTIDEILYMVTKMIGLGKLKEVKNYITQMKELWGMLENKSTDEVIKKALQSANIGKIH